VDTSRGVYLLTCLLKIKLNLCGETLCTAAGTGLLYQLRMIGDGDCGKIVGMKIGRGNTYLLTYLRS
jgi:hypothetical protein